MIQFQNIASRPDFRPQAIIWRPASYFSPIVKRDVDELDEFHYVSFCIGNLVSFEMRTYAGHPQETSTVYLSFADNEVDEIRSKINLILTELCLPNTALAWIRGREFKYGVLKRPVRDRLLEKEARSLVLKIAAKEPARRATTTKIKSRIPVEFNLSPLDLEQSVSRPAERKWQQIVGNVISHRTSANSIISRGFALREGEFLTVTSAGLDYLNSIGFSVASSENRALHPGANHLS
jgi:hypothetical protein